MKIRFLSQTKGEITDSIASLSQRGALFFKVNIRVLRRNKKSQENREYLMIHITYVFCGRHDEVSSYENIRALSLSLSLF